MEKAVFKRKVCENCGYKHDVKMPYCPKCEQTPENLAKRHDLLADLDWKKSFMLVVFWVVFILIIPMIVISFIVAGMEGNIEENLLKVSSDPHISTVTTLIFGAMAIGASILLLRRYIKPFIYSLKGGKQLLGGLICGLILWVAATGVSALLNAIFKVGTNENQAMIIQESLKSPLLFFLTTAIIAPILEEFTFRLGMFNFFKKFSKPTAYIVSSLIFALIHINLGSADLAAELVALLSYLIAAFGLGYVYDRFGFGGSTVAHITNNTISAIILLISAAI